MRKMKFSSQWIGLIMWCVIMVSYTSLINGTPFRKFESLGGIRKVTLSHLISSYFVLKPSINFLTKQKLKDRSLGCHWLRVRSISTSFLQMIASSSAKQTHLSGVDFLGYWRSLKMHWEKGLTMRRYLILWQEY